MIDDDEFARSDLVRTGGKWAAPGVFVTTEDILGGVMTELDPQPLPVVPPNEEALLRQAARIGQAGQDAAALKRDQQYRALRSARLASERRAAEDSRARWMAGLRARSEARRRARGSGRLVTR